MFANIFNTNTTAFKQTAFTIVELLVVIVIIGILSTVSVATFSSQKSQPLIAKYQAEKNQAARLHFEECVKSGFTHCGPNFVIYLDLQGSISEVGLRKKNIPSASSEKGDYILRGVVPLAIAVDPSGDYFYHVVSGNLYRKEFNTDINDLGTLINSNFSAYKIELHPEGNAMSAFHFGKYYFSMDDIASVTTDSVTNAYSYNFNVDKPSLTPDGKSLLYIDTRDANNLRKISTSKAGSTTFDINTVLGEVIHNNVREFAITRDQKYLIYRNSADNRIYKKPFLAPADSQGTLFLNQGSFRYATITQDNQYLLYEETGNGLTYLKSVNESDPNNPGNLFLEGNAAGHRYTLFP